MAINVSFYIMNKRENSTLKPSGGDITFPCILKDATGIISPTIMLTLPSEDNITPTNYAYIHDFNRYYFIKEWTYDKGYWIAEMQVDVLATWKDSIGASTQYILRSASAHDGDIMDGIYPTKAGITVTTNSVLNPWTPVLNNGRYVVGIINSDQSGVGGVSYYVFTQSQMQELNHILLQDPGWLEIPDTEISVELSKALFNPYQYITSCMWFPFAVPTSGNVSSLEFGWWNIPVSCARLPNNPYQTSFELQIPKHPQALARGRYLNLSPYSRYMLRVKPFGDIPIDSTTIINSASLKIFIRVDLITGKSTLTASLEDGFDTIIATDVSMCAVPIQLAQISRDYLGVASTAIDMAGNIGKNLLSGNVAGALTGAVSGIASTIEASVPQLRTTGSTGSLSDFILIPRLQGQFFPLVDEDIEDRGRPLCSKRVINTLTGFIMVADADIALPSTAEENARIKSYMINGFFYE